MNKHWVEFVKRLNDIQNQHEGRCFKYMIEYFATILDCKNAYLIKVKDKKLNWSTYTFYGDRQTPLNLPLSVWHQEILLDGKIKRYENLLILPLMIDHDLVMILGFHQSEALSDDLCEQIMTMAEVGYQRIEKNKMIRELKKSEQILKMTIEQIGSGMYQMDCKGNIKFANAKFYEIIGYTKEEAKGLSISDITYEKDLKKDVEHKKKLQNKEVTYYSIEKRYVKKNGDLTWVHVTATRMEGEAFEEDYLIGLVQDINSHKKAEALQKNQEKALEKLVKERTQALVHMNKALIAAHTTKDAGILELKETKKALEEMSIKDPLTQLYNRRYMLEQLGKEMERYERYKTPFVLIMADIDYFKEVNDTFGHEGGDYVLKDVSHILTESLRKIDVLCRWGGEEFLILLPETLLEGGIFVAERMRSAILSNDFIYNDEKYDITMTFGVSSNVNSDSIETIIKKADDALFVGKKQGRNLVVKEKM